ncbi:common pilus major fimbrillin subunit EcpA [Dryocola sp. LX212]
MKNIARIAVLTALALSTVSAFAAETVANDSASWNVTATKDSSAKLVVTPRGSIDFQYAKSTDGTTGNFNQAQALFDVTVDNTGMNATAFKLETRANAQKSVQDASGASMDVILSANGTALEQDTWTTLNDETNTFHGLETLTGLSDGIEKGSSYFEARLGNFADATGASVTDASLMPDGIYSGVVTAEFKATWTADDAA